MYRVYDSCGELVKYFPTFMEALNYKITFGNSGWYITLGKY